MLDEKNATVRVNSSHRILNSVNAYDQIIFFWTLFILEYSYFKYHYHLV